MLNEEDKLKDQQNQIEILRTWLLRQPHLPHDIEDRLLLSFVCGTKSLEIAKQKLDSWLTNRGKNPHVFSFAARNIHSKEFKDLCDATKTYILPKTTPEGYRVVLSHPGKDISKFEYLQCSIRFRMICELAMDMWPDSKGFITVVDCDSKTITKLDLNIILEEVLFYQQSCPLKLKGILFVNTYQFAEKIMKTVVKPLVKEKIYKRVHISHKGAEFIKKFIPEDILPQDFGGKEKHSDELAAEWQKIMEERESWFKKWSDYLVSDESKRLHDAKHTYGVQGTFRSLAID